MPPQISSLVPENKRVILEDALLSPNDPAHQIIIEKAREREWLTEGPTKVKSLVKGIQSGLSFGLSKQAAGLGAGFGEVLAVSPEVEEPRGIKGLAFRFKRGFKSGISEERADIAAAQEAHPKLFTVGDIAGSAITSVVPIGLAGQIASRSGKGALLATKFLKGVQTTKGAAKLGGAEAAFRQMTEEQKVSPSSLARVAGAGAFGAAFAGASQALANKIVTKLSSMKAKPLDIEIELTANTSASDELAPSQTVLVKESLDPLSEIKTKLSPPKANDEQAAIAKMATRSPEDVSYFQANKDRILKTPSLNENTEIPMSAVFVDDYSKLQARLSAREELAQNLLENSNVEISTKDLRSVWNSKINEIRKSGKFRTPEGQKAVKLLEDSRDLLPKGEMTEFWDARRLREYIRGLWETNKAFFAKRANPAADIPFSEKMFDEVASKNMNEHLKNIIPGWRELMENYADEVRISREMEKTLNVNNWFKNRIVKPVADFVDGTATTRKLFEEQKSWLSTLKKFGDVIGRDYFSMIKDRLVFGRLFPELATGGDLGPLTNQIGRLAGQAIRGNIPLAMLTGTGAVGEVKNVAAEKALQIYLLNPKSFTSRIAGKISLLPTRVVEAGRRGLIGTGKAIGASGIPSAVAIQRGIAGAFRENRGE